HYLAPELARGEQATQQSDIYALGIVFYEMLTGDVPHHGDAPVQVALKHLREQIPSVRDFNPDIPQSIDNIIRKATVKNRMYRYPTAAAMYDDLVTCLDEDRKNEKMVIFEPEEKKTASEEESEEKKKDTKKKKKKKKIVGLTTGFIVFLVLVGAILLSLFLIKLLGNPSKPMSAIPAVRDMTVEEAKKKLESEGFYAVDTLSYELTDDQEKGRVIRTMPAEGTMAEKGSSVELFVSEGKYYVMENFVGLRIDDARRSFDECCKIKINVSYENTTSLEPGIITYQSVEPFTKINPTKLQEIRFTITQYPVIDLPYNLIGMNIDEAKAALEELGVKVEISGSPRPKMGHWEEVHNEHAGELDEDGNIIPETSQVYVEEYTLDESYIGVVYGTDPDAQQPYEQTGTSVFTLYYYSE
ncbi:MAG: PASTA domain-containing protein, partial [Erysipelotrichales bacterium]|nr:PASTA domain-containing protein [Erysipelotrichales bacterium]